MKQFLTVTIVAMFGLLCAPVADAGIVDSFESSTNASGFAGPAVTRTTEYEDGFLPSAGIIFFTNGGEFGEVNYSVAGGSTFGSYGDTFSVGVESTLASYDLLLTNDLGQSKFWSGQSPASTSLSLEDSASFSVTGANELNFTFIFTSAGTFGFGAGGDFEGFSAVPEPTSLAMVGLAVGGLALRRRRRS